MVDSLDRRIALQQETTRQILETPANAHALHAMLEWFAGVPAALPGDEHMAQLAQWAEVTNRLGVLGLDEHRSAVSGAFAAALHKEYPDLDDPDTVLSVDVAEMQKHLHGVALRTVQVALSMTPPNTNIHINHVRQVDWIWMAWAVSRKRSLLGRLTELAARSDEIGGTVIALFEDNQALVEIQPEIVAIRRRKAHRVAPTGASPKQRKRLSDLCTEVTKHPLWARKVWLVAWDAERYFVVTDGGVTPPGCPLEWDDLPVVVREPTKQETRDRHRLRDLGDEP